MQHRLIIAKSIFNNQNTTTMNTQPTTNQKTVFTTLINYAQKVWTDEISGEYCETYLNATLSGYIALLDKLTNNRIQPCKIIGSGYKNPRKSAFDYLNSQISKYTNYVNRKEIHPTTISNYFFNMAKICVNQGVTVEQKEYFLEIYKQYKGVEFAHQIKVIEPTLDELKAQYLAMHLDDLRRIKKEKYSNMDITTAMSNDEKAIVETIAIKFAELNQKIKQKRQAEKAAANQVEIIEATKEEVAHYINNGMFENDAIEKVLASYNECLYSFGKDSFHGQQYQIEINYLKSLIEPQPTNQNETMQPQPTQPQTLTVGQTIQGENCHLVVTVIKEAKQANNEVKPTINRLKENISRLEKTIESGAFQKGYIENCKKDIDSYKTQIEKLLSQQAETQPTQEPANEPIQEPSKPMLDKPTTPATYAKYCPNVFVAKCDQQHEKGSIIEIETKYGKIHEVEVYNLVAQKNGFFYYSIVRTDGYNVQERAKQKAERYAQWAKSADKKSTQYYEASNEGRDFLSLGEPIKVGHHSEKRHRALIDRNWERMGKSVEMSKKADFHNEKAAYWADKADTINLSMPESLEYFEFKLEQAKKEHEGLKNGTIKRSHSFSLTYAKKAVNELENKVKTAHKLWA